MAYDGCREPDFNSKTSTIQLLQQVQTLFSEMEVWRASAEGLKVVIVNPVNDYRQRKLNESSGLIYENFPTKVSTFSGGTSYVDVRERWQKFPWN